VVADPRAEPSTKGWKPRDILFISIAALVSLALGLVLASGFGSRDSQNLAGQGYPGMGGDFSLTSSTGPVSLSDMSGKVVVLYFGYSSCPDICPTSLAVISAALQQLDAEERKQIQPVFVGVDPQRDTPEVLAEYTHAFYPGMLGLTGTKEQIDTVTGQYKVHYEIVPLKDSAAGYGVNHSSITFVIGRDGVVRDILGHGAPLESLVMKLKSALEA
jgi:protein SCO1/2